MNHNITDLGIPAESELRGIGIIYKAMDASFFYKSYFNPA
jgi:hypothetical protein